MKFSDIPGHEQVKKTMREMVGTGHVPHALMLSGPTGVGKMLLARTFAQYLQCTSPRDGEPCGMCTSCRLHAESGHPDVHFVYPINKSKTAKRIVSTDVSDQWHRMLAEYPTMPEERWLELLEAGNSQPGIHVEEADDIVRADAYPPYSSKYRIFIIWQPERLRPEAANKLLKVIEEPAEGTVFILVSNNELQVLPTIFSRVQRLHAGRLSDREIAKYLEQHYDISDTLANQYAPLCNGSLTRAEELGSNSGEGEEFLALYMDIMRSAYAKKVAHLRQIGDKVAAFGREKARRFLDYMARMIRENFIYNLHQPTLTSMTREEENFSVKFSPFVNHSNVEDFLAETGRAKRDIERNANGKVVMFDYLIQIIILLHRKPD